MPTGNFDPTATWWFPGPGISFRPGTSCEHCSHTFAMILRHLGRWEQNLGTFGSLQYSPVMLSKLSHKLLERFSIGVNSVNPALQSTTLNDSLRCNQRHSCSNSRSGTGYTNFTCPAAQCTLLMTASQCRFDPLMQEHGLGENTFHDSIVRRKTALIAVIIATAIQDCQQQTGRRRVIYLELVLSY